MIAFWFD